MTDKTSRRKELVESIPKAKGNEEEENQPLIIRNIDREQHNN